MAEIVNKHHSHCQRMGSMNVLEECETYAAEFCTSGILRRPKTLQRGSGVQRSDRLILTVDQPSIQGQFNVCDWRPSAFFLDLTI
jgi:hypothetical protein